MKYGRSNVTTSIIREMVNVKLFQRGLEAKLADHSRIGLPVHDLETMMFNKNKENSNTSHNPESINLSIAEMVLKEYALTKVFSKDVADAHLKGDIHLHDLGMVNRPYCSGQRDVYKRQIQPTRSSIIAQRSSSKARPPVRIIISTLPQSAAARAAISPDIWSASALTRSAALSSPDFTSAMISLKSFVPR